jgi:hypothetical protein
VGQAVGQDAGRDPLLGGQELGEGALAEVDDVADHQQGPRVAERLQPDVDRTVRLARRALHPGSLTTMMKAI